MQEVLKSTLLQVAIGVIILSFIVQFLARGYRYRVQRRRLPGPPPSWLFGDLKTMGEAAAACPRRVHPHGMDTSRSPSSGKPLANEDPVYPTLIRKKYNLKQSYMYLDMWPVSDPMIAIFDPAICQQFSVEHNTTKHRSLPYFLEHIAGRNDMVSANGNQWRKWRSMFNPGFSTQHLMTLVPGIIDDALVYVEKLREFSQDKTLFRLEEHTTRLTIDIIGKVALDLHFNMQRSENECITALREQVHFLPNETLNPLAMYHPYGIYRRWRNARTMERYIGKVLDERFAAKDPASIKQQRRRTIMDLALDTYLSGESDNEGASKKPAMDAEFREGAITQIRICIFAGHDTTSSTICYAFYLLQKHPECLRRIRREHEEVLGPVSTTTEVLKKEPHLLNKLEYTLCVIKEVLRMFPVASAPRNGEKGLFIVDPTTGEKFHTEGWMVWLVHYGLGRNEDVWGDTANDFIPERFLPGNSGNIPEGAWRSFENGPRNCLGQNLALLEARIILAMTCRSFEFDVAVDDASLEEIEKDGSFYAKDKSFRQGRQEVWGEEMYQVLVGSAKPREGMPCRVRSVEWTA